MSMSSTLRRLVNTVQTIFRRSFVVNVIWYSIFVAFKISKISVNL